MHIRASARYLLVKGDGVLKVIPRFKKFSIKMQTSFDAIKRTYKAANNPENLANPCLTVARRGPEMHRSTYQVLAGPLGYRPTFRNEQVSTSGALWFSLSVSAQSTLPKGLPAV